MPDALMSGKFCRKMNAENQLIMNPCDNYDTNFPRRKLLKQLKINEQNKNKDLYTTENDKIRQFENGKDGLQNINFFQNHGFENQ